MPRNISAQNSFIRGLITEATGLNFPENAATSTSNCVYSLIGDVTRRYGINYEDNYRLNNIGPSGNAVTTFRWKNAGGDGETEILVEQNGNVLYFFQSTNSTVTSPLSTTMLPITITISSFQALDNTENVASVECQFAAGNGYLFVYHPFCEPFYCTYTAGQIVANQITLQTRDFLGYQEFGNPNVSLRPTTLSKEHNYNLQNQGWTGIPSWQATQTLAGGNNNYGNFTVTSDQASITVGVNTFTVASGISGVTVGQNVSISWTINNQICENVQTSAFVNVGSMIGTATGTVNSYSSGTLVINVAQSTTFSVGSGYLIIQNYVGHSANSGITCIITPGSTNNAIGTFFSDVGVYPSNSDIWYTFKDDTGLFNPTTTVGSVLPSSTQAPQGHFILNTFIQNQLGLSNIAGLNSPFTTMRPSTGAWFQGRVWYSGVNASSAPQADFGFYTWTENIYFSQIITPGDTTSFGYCYQENDPTDENLFNILPTDGGVITIPGSGNIFKLFPIQNGMIIFAANGVWFITGSQGIGFSATDYTITKLSSVQSISSTSFIEVMGLPFFWNEEGIYRVVPAQQQGIGLAVEPLTVGTILSFYNDIPLDSKVYARGDYDPINYVIKWVYRSTQEAGQNDRYQYDSVLNFNIYNKSFYPYSISSTSSTPYVSGLFYLNYPNSITAPDPGFKYTCNIGSEATFAEENDDTYLDWNAVSGQNYDSYFVTGYALHGKGVFKWQPVYLYMYSRNETPISYNIQGRWDYSVAGPSGRWSTIQQVRSYLGQPNQGMLIKRHKIRGHGHVFQIMVSSVQGHPFDIMGWTMVENIDAGV